jgi:hypothetical protein
MGDDQPYNHEADGGKTFKLFGTYKYIVNLLSQL